MIELVLGDITKQATDAIVNAANSSLLGGGGVDGAIHRAGGPDIIEACKKIVARQGPLQAGNAVITSAGNLPCKFVIHTVGPIWHGGFKGEPLLLSNCYENSMKLAVETGIGSIAFPNISTGVYGYPKKEAAEIAVTAVQKFISEHEAKLDVIFVCFDQENYDLYDHLLNS